MRILKFIACLLFGLIFLIMVGIMVHHLTYLPEGLAIPGVLFLINAWILWDNREKYQSIICNQ